MVIKIDNKNELSIPKNQPKENLLGDIESIMQSISKSIPMIDEEVLYKFEYEKQKKIYLFFAFIGMVMILLVFFL